ncbi:4-(cytidine 5'-diphospho)-2-C-methyl-D-erythritol kinase [Virgibacillus siamensis]|uniref:4-(cytidine 5'-diphospho)-2-C-methyl-D-erythritol kinase n=1 Tax=Virgibacillus siamensis TaxID=480071 RepID=UPI00098433D2|nr:4-(cytidine 5'-diphospho)-2-C-methyl-D-erythritol kinase [Virgibacillus siamensis]
MIIFERAPAKINLSLDVLGKRNDGFHEVEMIMTSVDLTDRLELMSSDNGKIDVAADNQYVPNDERNLAYKAALAFKNKYRIHKGVQIKITKNIPVSAGLGGGSSDAAAVLRGLNKLWSVGASKQELAEIGAFIGSDVPFCVYSTTAIGTGHGEKIYELPSPPPFFVILAKPNIGISTRNIFPKVKMKELVHPDTQAVIKALEEKDFPGLCAAAGNALETVTFSLFPNVAQIKAKMLKAGAEGVLMSGSGPTMVGLVQHYSKAKRIYNGLRGFCEEVFIVQMLDRR